MSKLFGQSRLPFITVTDSAGTFEVGPSADGDPTVLLVRSRQFVLRNRTQFNYMLANVRKGKGGVVFLIKRPANRKVTPNHEEQALKLAIRIAERTWQERAEDLRALFSDMALKRLIEARATVVNVTERLAEVKRSLRAAEASARALGVDVAQWATTSETFTVEEGEE